MNKDALLEIRRQIDAAIESDTPEAYRVLAASLAEALTGLEGSPPVCSATGDQLGRALKIIEEVWSKGSEPPAELAGSADHQTLLSNLLSDMRQLQSFSLSMSKGDLSQTAKIKGLMAGSLKALQANLRHLTWQTRMIAKGDLSQRVDFMGEFSRSFNSMVQSLAEMRDHLKRDAEELSRANANLLAEIGERRRAEEALRENEERFRSTFEQAAVGIAHVSLDGRFLRVNQKLCSILGYTVEELLGLTFSDITHPDDLRETLVQLQRLLTGEIDTFSLEKREVRKDGGGVWVNLTVSLHRDVVTNDRNYFITVVEEISKRKGTEKALQRTLSELERSNAELQQFAYVASHDLQEPLRMISSYLRLIERRYKGKIDQDADDFIGFAVDGAKRMQGLINDVLQLSRLGTREKSLTATDSEAILKLALANLKASIEASEAQVTHDPLPAVTVDATQIVQLFQNLIGNAIKFHGKDKPLIHISAGPRDGEWLFSVRDNGIGIDPQYSNRIFGIFHRLHGRAEYPGTGIGLAICKKVVEGHGGRIWVQSEPEKGATFFFTLPMRTEQQ